MSSVSPRPGVTTARAAAAVHPAIAKRGAVAGVGGMDQALGFQPGRGAPAGDLPRAGLRRGSLARVQALGPAYDSSRTARLTAAGILTLGSCMLTCLLWRRRKATQSDY